MKVWHLTKTLEGGAGQYANRLNLALIAQGVESVVLTSGGGCGKEAGGLVRSDGSVRRFLSRVQRSMVRRISTEPFHLMNGLERYVVFPELGPPSVVHLHGMTGWIGFDGLNRLIPRGTPVFQTTHSPFDFSGGCVLRAGATCQRFLDECHQCPVLKAPVRWLAHQELKKKTHWTGKHGVKPIANSKWMADRVAESPVFGRPGSVPVVPPIISDIFWSAGRSDLRDELEIKKDRKLVCLGAKAVTDRGKGISEFFGRIADHRRLHEQMTFVVFGEGEFSVPSGVDARFLGGISDEKSLAAVFRSCDVFVSPSSMETFGMTLAEAQAAGCAVVGFNVGGIADAVYPQHHHRLVACGDWEALFRCLEETAGVAGARGGELAAMKWIGSQFGGQAVADRQIEIYSKAITGNLSGERI